LNVIAPTQSKVVKSTVVVELVVVVVRGKKLEAQRWTLAAVQGPVGSNHPDAVVGERELELQLSFPPIC
jgi:hypothetical protein